MPENKKTLADVYGVAPQVPDVSPIGQLLKGAQVADDAAGQVLRGIDQTAQAAANVVPESLVPPSAEVAPGLAPNVGDWTAAVMSGGAGLPGMFARQAAAQQLNAAPRQTPAARSAGAAAEYQRLVAEQAAAVPQTESNPYLAAEGGGGGFGVGAGASMGGGEVVAPQTAPMDRRGIDASMREQRTALGAEQQAVEQQGLAQQRAALQNEATYRDQMLAQQRAADVERDAAVATQQEMSVYRQKVEEAVQRIGEPGQVDQNRLWNRMDTGGKILAGIGMLFGAVGGAAKGENAALKIFQDAIKQDLEVQQQNIANRRDAARAQLQGYGQLADMTRQMGLDARGSRLAELELKTQAVASQLQATAAKLGGEEAPLKAAQVVAKLQGDLAGELGKYEADIATKNAQIASQNNDRKLQASIANMQAQNQAYIAMLRATAKMGKQEVTKLEQQPLRVLNDTKFAAEAVEQLTDQLKQLGPRAVDKFTNALANTDTVSAAWEMFTGQVPEARKYDKVASAWLRVIGVAVDSGSVLREGEVKEWKQIIGNSSLGGEYGLRQLSGLMENKYNTSLSGYFMARRNVHAFPFLGRDANGRLVSLPLGVAPKGLFPQGTAQMLQNSPTTLTPSGPPEAPEE